MKKKKFFKISSFISYLWTHEVTPFLPILLLGQKHFFKWQFEGVKINQYSIEIHQKDHIFQLFLDTWSDPIFADFAPRRKTIFLNGDLKGLKSTNIQLKYNKRTATTSSFWGKKRFFRYDHFSVIFGHIKCIYSDFAPRRKTFFFKWQFEGVKVNQYSIEIHQKDRNDF